MVAKMEHAAGVRVMGRDPATERAVRGRLTRLHDAGLVLIDTGSGIVAFRVAGGVRSGGARGEGERKDQQHARRAANQASTIHAVE